MLHQRLTGIALALAFGTLPATAWSADLTLYHSWSNESEMAALNTIVKAFEAKGNTITAASVPHETAGESPLTSLIVAGTPPNLFIAADAGTYRDLESRGEVIHNVNMAAALITAIPPLVVYFALGKFFVQGITSGALKG